MKFCPIMPVAALSHFGNSSTSWMALAQHLHIPAYLRFFQEKVQAGQTVILDNGAYEGVQMPAWKLNSWARELRPTVLILPDSPGRFVETLYKGEDYLERFGLPKGVEGMMVLHAEDGQLRYFEMAYELVKVSWVGFSRLTKSYGSELCRWPQHRWAFASWLHSQGMWRPELKHHALGMLNGDLEELTALNKEGFESCDSSAPIWRGMHGYEIEDTDWPNYEMEPLCAKEAGDLEMAERNLKLVLEACNGQG